MAEHESNFEVPQAPRRTREAGVPRRFGIGTLLIATAMFSVLFAVLQALGFPPLVFLIVVLFVTTIGISQALLFHGEHPRRASVLVGGLFFPVLLALAVVYMTIRNGRPSDPTVAQVYVLLTGFSSSSEWPPVMSAAR